MRFGPLLLAALLAAPITASADPQAAQAEATPAVTTPAGTPATPAKTEPAKGPPVEESAPQFGLQLAIGVPDGVALSFTYSPLYWVMADLGFAYTLQPGLVVGLEFRPLDFIVTPLIRGEYGYYFPGNTPEKIMTWAGVSPEQQALIGTASYHWFAGFLGLAIGSRNGFTFALEGGIGSLTLNARGGTTVINGTTVTTSDWKSTSFLPMARISFLYFF